MTRKKIIDINRKKIELSDTTADVLLKMAEGNPGAITVLTAILDTYGNEGLMLILSLDDMNVRGSQIWVGYKDYCGEDINKFVQCINDRDRDMLNTINSQCYRPEIDNDACQHMAVRSGASFA